MSVREHVVCAGEGLERPPEEGHVTAFFWVQLNRELHFHIQVVPFEQAVQARLDKLLDRQFNAISHLGIFERFGDVFVDKIES